MDLNDLLDDLSSTTKDEFSSIPDVVDGSDDLDVSTLPIAARKWTRMRDVVVVADLEIGTTGDGLEGNVDSQLRRGGHRGCRGHLRQADANFI